MIVQQGQKKKWYIDTPCSNYMTGKKELFSMLGESYKSEVKSKDENLLKIEGKGIITFYSKEGTALNITNFHYVPELTQNLLSIGQLMRGYSINFNDDHCIIFYKKKKLTMTRIKMIPNKNFP